MKGPGLRNDLEIRRLWRCPQCQREILRLGDVVAESCSCTTPPCRMQLIPRPKPAPRQYDRIVIPLTEEDLVIRIRPPRIVPPVEVPPEEATPEGAEGEQSRDRRSRPQRRERPPQLTAKLDPEIIAQFSSPTREKASSADVPAEPVAPPPAPEPPPVTPEDDFGAGLV